MSASQPYEEKELLSQFQKGGQDAFTAVYKRMYERLFWYGSKYIDVQEEVEDVIAEAFIQLWKHREQFDTMESVSAFLHVIVRNRCFNLLKRRQMLNSRKQYLLQLLEQEEAGSFHIEDLRIALLQKIFAAVDQLPEKMREIFLLSYQEGLKPAQIAQKLQISVQTVSNQKLNAVKILKTVLSDHPLLIGMLLLMEMKM